MKLGELPPGTVVRFEMHDLEYTVMSPEAKVSFVNIGPGDVKLRFPEPGIDEDVANARAPDDCEMAESRTEYSLRHSGWVLSRPDQLPERTISDLKHLVLSDGPQEWDE